MKIYPIILYSFPLTIHVFNEKTDDFFLPLNSDTIICVFN